ncbi:hypothetical protein TTHERM_00377340 (macronuclear) [Tetrahymena thermophila SB210]|uniref:Uncharacterized protein n=1 Tax=Tetrahymena thermophila (strain SB210) TaxID=312017 RepID=Q23FI4_TETTS|nr:hypothetical protein TTHERM_00377340 [Tetrahymena thermophila SB210]EAR95169.2 hypothetical protein TTHERM_00377340 [Tetrahymena thermophila SB210]|eukprot:XP_001015414.2 hypothetical protein TTHERM_00377340 [Tetrahymena thermophila SB210]
MIEESSTFFKESPSESSTTILKLQSTGLNLDSQLTQIELHDEDNFQHLALSYQNNQLSFQMLSIYQLQNDSQKYLRAEQIQLSKDVQASLSMKLQNVQVKQLKMTKQEVNKYNSDDIFDEECQEPESPKFATSTPQISYKQTYIAVVMLDIEIIVLKFEILTKKEKSKFYHSLEQICIKNIQFEGHVSELFLNKQKESMVIRINHEQQTKIHLIDKFMGQHIIRDIAVYYNDFDIVIGKIGVSSELAVIRVITKNQKDLKKFFINTLFVSQIGISGIQNNQENMTLKVQTNKKPLTSLLNEINYTTCQTLFSQTSSYLVISDGQNIEVQDFNNISQKNVIKEFIPKANTGCQQQSKVQKIMQNLEKSTLLIANSSVNQFVSLYNFDNPISILDQINFSNNEQVAIKSVIVSSVPYQGFTPQSASNLMESFSHIKASIYSNQILALAFLEDNSIVPFTIDKEILDMKVPELKFVSSQITNMYNYEDSQHFFNDFESGFSKQIKANFDVFKTPDRKASFTFLNSSLENNKFHFSSSVLPQNSSSQPNNANYSSQTNQNLTFQSHQRQGKSLNFDHPGTNRERERSVSQESNSSRNFSAYKPSINGSNLNNKKTLFNENSNTLFADDCSYQIQKANKKEKDIQINPILQDKISPTQQKINETQNSSESEESELVYSRPKSFKLDTYEGSPLLTKQKMSNRSVPGNSNRFKDFSRIAMKKQINASDNIPLPIFNKTEISQDDIIEPNSFSQRRKQNNFFECHSSTHEDIENTYNSKQTTQSSNEISLVSYRRNSNQQTFNLINSQNEIKDYENEDISNIQSQELNYNNQQEHEQLTISSKKINIQRENNIFDKNLSTTTTISKISKANNSSESKNKNNSSSKKKNITPFLTTSPSPQSPLLGGIYNSSQLKNPSINQKLPYNNFSSFSYPKKTHPFMNQSIKSIDFDAQNTQQLSNEKQQNAFKNHTLQYEGKNKSFLDESTLCLQQPIFNSSYFFNNTQNNNNNNNNFSFISNPKKKFQPLQQQQQQMSQQNSQQLLGKRKSQQQLLTSFSGNLSQLETRKMVKKQQD